MMKNVMKCGLGAVLAGVAVWGVAVVAAEDKSGKASLEQVKAAIASRFHAGKPGIVVDSVEASAVPGLYKVSVGAGGPNVYATADGRYFIAGDIYEVSPGNIVNLTERDRNGDRAKAVAAVDKKDMIIFSPKGEVKQVIYVFTDVDCGYCQIMHQQMAGYHDLGIEVRYLAYPRAGLQSQSYIKVASAWCAKDRQDALTKLKLRQNIPNNVCDGNPVASQFELGRKIGLSGTPAIILENGELIAGYLEPARLASALGLQ